MIHYYDHIPTHEEMMRDQIEDLQEQVKDYYKKWQHEKMKHERATQHYKKAIERLSMYGFIYKNDRSLIRGVLDREYYYYYLYNKEKQKHERATQRCKMLSKRLDTYVVKYSVERAKKEEYKKIAEELFSENQHLKINLRVVSFFNNLPIEEVEKLTINKINFKKLKEDGTYE